MRLSQAALLQVEDWLGWATILIGLGFVPCGRQLLLSPMLKLHQLPKAYSSSCFFNPHPRLCFYWSLEKEEGGEREILIICLPYRTQLGVKPAAFWCKGWPSNCATLRPLLRIAGAQEAKWNHMGKEVFGGINVGNFPKLTDTTP